MPRKCFTAGIVALAAAGCAPAPAPRLSPAAPLPAPGEAMIRPARYVEVWRDGFDDGDRPDPARWRYDTSRNAKGWFNGEQQYYARGRRENARIANGRLVIEARAEALAGKGLPDWSGQPFSSARLTTRGTAAWRHGWFEVRAKLPCVKGAWPAIWMLPEHQDMRWQGGEIDLAEAVGHEPSSVHHGVQTADNNFVRGNQLEAVLQVDYCGAFHDYQLHWTDRAIFIGIDGRVAFATSQVAAFDRRMVLILNVAVGGDWAGAQGIAADRFPATMEIERVSVWQEDEQR